MHHFFSGLIAVLIFLGSDASAQYVSNRVSNFPTGHRYQDDISSSDTVYAEPTESFGSFSWHDLFNGISYFPASGIQLATNPPVEMFNFNTVEGVNINMGLKYIQGDERKKHF